MLLHAEATDHHGHPDPGVLGSHHQVTVHLHGQLPGGGQDQGPQLVPLIIHQGHFFFNVKIHLHMSTTFTALLLLA